MAQYNSTVLVQANDYVIIFNKLNTHGEVLKTFILTNTKLLCTGSINAQFQKLEAVEIISSAKIAATILQTFNLTCLMGAYVFGQDANSGNITKIGKERARGD